MMMTTKIQLLIEIIFNKLQLFQLFRKSDKIYQVSPPTAFTKKYFIKNIIWKNIKGWGGPQLIRTVLIKTVRDENKSFSDS